MVALFVILLVLALAFLTVVLMRDRTPDKKKPPAKKR